MRARRAIRRFWTFLKRPSVWLSLCVLIVALLVWFVGPAIAFGEAQPLGSATVRLACLLVLALIWGIGSFFVRTRRSSEDEALLAALRRQEEEAEAARNRSDAAADAEIAAFRDAGRAVLSFLRRRGGFRFVSSRYTLPWYIVLGANNVGKSSVLKASGIAAPYDTDPGSGPAQFHITDKAVLVEFEGRFTAANDTGAVLLWQRMLDQLRRWRRQQPVNGILLVLDVQYLLSRPEEQIVAEAASLRKRLDETMARLRTTAPVYVLVNKLDMVVGFEEFFDSLTSEERNAVLGVPLSALRKTDGATARGSFLPGFSNIVEGFSRHQFLRLQDEPDELRRRRIFEFPGQFSLLQSRLTPFLWELCVDHRFADAPNVRGVFFSSTVQSGDFRDGMGPVLAPSFGQRRDGLFLQPETGQVRARPFFLSGLFRDVILPEANLGGLTRPALVANRLYKVGGNLLLFALIALMISLWILSFGEGRAYTARIATGVEAGRANIAEASPNGKMPSQFDPVLEVLDRLRTLAEEEPRRATLGLYSAEPVNSAARDAYDKALANLLFPFVWSYLRDGLDHPETPAALRFQQLKFYLTLTEHRVPDRETADLLSADFATNWLVHEADPGTQLRIARHFAALAAAPLTVPPADTALVNRARRWIADYTLARLGYDLVQAMPAVQALPVWRPVDHMGLTGPQALSRVSGDGFWDGVPGLYTRDGLIGTMREVAATAARHLADDLWVMGDDAPLGERDSARIRDGILDLYRVDYINKWSSLLADIGPAGADRAVDVAHSIAIITGNPSPLKELLTAIAAETDLEAATTVVLDAAVGATTARIKSVTGSAYQPRRSVDVAKSVSEYFRAFRNAVMAPEGQQAPADAMLAAMQPLYRMLNHVANGGDVLELGTEPQTLLKDLASRNDNLPPVLQPVFARILAQVAAITGGSSRERLAQIWKTTVLPLCDATMTARYPFDRTAANDTSLEDFAKLFGPKGAIAGFHNDYLKPFIDTTTHPWRWRPGQQVGLGFDDATLAGLEQANAITTMFFSDQEKPNLDFMITPGKLDAKARAFVLDAGGQSLLYSHGPIVDTPFQWPPQNVSAGANLSVMPEVQGERNLIARQGPWAIFRLLDSFRMMSKQPTDSVDYLARVGSRRVLLRVTASATRNPFAKNILAGYACPQL